MTNVIRERVARLIGTGKTIFSGRTVLEMNWKEALEALTKIGLLSAGFFYVVGFLITSIHARQYGVSGLNFVRPEYISVGFVWFFLTLATTLILITWIDIVYGTLHEKFRSGSRPIKVVILFLFVLVPLGLVMVSLPLFLNIFLDQTVSVVRGAFWILMGVLLLNAIAFTLVLLAVIGYLHVAEVMRDSHVFDVVGPLYLPVFTIAVTFGAIYMYGLFVFPKISKVYAGGVPTEIEIVVKQERVASLISLGFSVDPESRTAGNLMLLIETSEFFVFAPPPDHGAKRSVRLQKDACEAIVYLNENRQK